MLTGELLDNVKCLGLYQKLDQYCNSPEGAPTAKALRVTTKGFMKQHLSKLWNQSDLVCKYDEKSSPKDLATKLMTEYTRFKFAVFAHLASRDFSILFSDHLTDDLKKALEMVMAFFKTQAEGSVRQPINMVAYQIVFAEKHHIKKMDEVKTDISHSSSRSPRVSPTAPESPAVIRLKLKLIRVICECEDPGVSDQFKLDLIKQIISDDRTDASRNTPTSMASSFAEFWQTNFVVAFSAAVGAAGAFVATTLMR